MHPLAGLLKEFLGGMNEPQSSSDSDSDKKEKRGGKWRVKRPVVLESPNDALYGQAGDYVIANVKIQNQSKWPLPKHMWVKKTSMDQSTFESLKIEQPLKHLDTSDLSLPIQLPEAIGESKAVFEFFNPKGKEIGQKVEVTYVVLPSEEAPTT